MLLTCAVIPLVAVLLLTAVLRRPAHIAAWCGVLVTVALTLLVPKFVFNPHEVAIGFGSAILLTADAAMVILPGLYLNELLAQRHVHHRLVGWVERLPMPTTDKVAIVVVGFAPALEALTGFGVSLLLTVPVLLALSPRPTALRQSMLSLNIMPWGTLGLATLVGSTLARQSLHDLGHISSLVSMTIFPVFGAISAALSVAPGGDLVKRMRPTLIGAGIGLVLSAGLVLFNWIGAVELAGVLAGLVAGLGGLVVLAKRRQGLLPPWTAIGPYALALGLVGVIRVVAAAGVPIDKVQVSIGLVDFQPLNSPGVPLLITALVLGRGRLSWSGVTAAAIRSRKTLTALLGFTVTALLMTVSGMVAVISELLAAQGVVGAVFLSPLLGLLSGFLTGSNTGGNALMIQVQTAFGAAIGHPLTLAAVQNSASGHAVFASLPEILLMLAVAGTAKDREESGLIRFGLRMLVVVYVVITTATAVLLTV